MSTLTVLLQGVCPRAGLHGSGKFLSYYNTQPLESQILIDVHGFLSSRRRSSRDPPVAITRGRRDLLPDPFDDPSDHRDYRRRAPTASRHRVLPDDRGGLDISIREASSLRKGLAEMFTRGITPPM